MRYSGDAMTAKMVRAGGDSGPFYVWGKGEVRRGLKAKPWAVRAPVSALGRKPERGCGGSASAAGDFRERD